MIINTIRFSQIKINKCTDMTICKHMCIEVQKQSTLESSISLKWPSGDSHISLLILFFQLQLIVLENLQVNLQMWEIMHVQYKWKSRRVLNFSIDKENKTHDRSNFFSNLCFMFTFQLILREKIAIWNILY